jgi:pentose-5-phosphate-3-epimerase
MKKNKNKIIPAILTEKWTEIEKLSNKFAESKSVQEVQIDFCDGIFVPSKTWPFAEKQDLDNFLKVGENFKNGKEEDIFLPNWEILNFTVDLMCNNPEKYLESLIAYGFEEIVIHFRSIQGANLLLTLEKFEEIEKVCVDYMLDLSIAIDLKTDLQEFINFGKKFENSIIWQKIQIMGIAEIGKQGEAFDEKVLEIIKKIKAEFPNKKIMMDGGMDFESIKKCKQAEAEIFVVGSALQKGDFKENFKELQEV